MNLNQTVMIKKGSLILLKELEGKVAIDISSSLTYSDLILNSNIWSPLNQISNQRLYLKYINPFAGYTKKFNIAHTYPSIGVYNLNISFETSSQFYEQVVSITESNIANKFYLKYGI